MMLGYPLLKAALGATQSRRLRGLLDAARSPDEAQAALLKGILETNADTAFGKRHGFAGLGTAADYRRAVPVHTYEDLRADIDRQELTGEPRLTRQRPTYYSRTSGTIAAPKNIPVTAFGMARIRDQRRLAAYALTRGPPVMAGKVFAITGQAVEGRMPGGTPHGSMSGLLYRNQPRLLRSRHVLPVELAAIADYESRYLAMAVYAVAEPQVSGIGTANSSTLIRLLSVINQRADEVLRAVADGRMPAGLAANLSPGRRRAARLRARLDAAGRLTYADIWPRLAGVVTWTGGSCGIALRNLKPALPADCAIIELGYIASEVHGTANVDPRRNICLPALQDAYFEFAEREAWEQLAPGADANGLMLSLGELQVGREYYVFVTTPDGLYRYDMSDIVRVTGKLYATPTLAFVQKGKGITNITGEKLHEAQVLDAVTAALDHGGVGADFFLALAEPEDAGYTLYLEAAGALNAELVATIATIVDGRLRELNVEYDAKRASGRLMALRVRRLRGGAGDAYRAWRVEAGQRDAQFKYLHLQYAAECAFDLAAFAAPE